MVYIYCFILVSSIFSDNARSSVDVFDTKLEREGSYIGLFVNKSSVEASSFMSKDQSLYTRYTDIRISSLNESHQTESR